MKKRFEITSKKNDEKNHFNFLLTKIIVFTGKVPGTRVERNLGPWDLKSLLYCIKSFTTTHKYITCMYVCNNVNIRKIQYSYSMHWIFDIIFSWVLTSKAFIVGLVNAPYPICKKKWRSLTKRFLRYTIPFYPQFFNKIQNSYSQYSIIVCTFLKADDKNISPISNCYINQSIFQSYFFFF